MMEYKNILIAYTLVINTIAYITMCFDKYQSKKKGQRISENTLLLIAFILGSLGIYIGMKAPMYHKATKAKFKMGVPLLIVVNGICIYFLIKY